MNLMALTLMTLTTLITLATCFFDEKLALRLPPLPFGESKRTWTKSLGFMVGVV